ncbi:hypothetical protein KY366_02620 [Candidatus Woesearchaeota archaeon]|nr:hypothetical protein [Candidatus Woesearchaeota archaeon]
MDEVMVSVRLPGSLLSELKRSAEKDHYMDISEEIRSIVRDRWLSSRNPELEELRKLKQDIKEELRKRSEKLVKLEIISELESIKKEIKKEAVSR